MKLGTYPALSLKEACSKARAELSKAEAGEDPAQEHRARKERRQRRCGILLLSQGLWVPIAHVIA